MKTNDKYFNRKKLKKQAKKSAFGRGFVSFAILVTVCFLFSFIGTASTAATSFISSTDSILGLVPENPQGNVEMLKDSLSDIKWITSIPNVLQSFIFQAFDALCKDFMWLINILASNASYFARNTKEVTAYIILAAIINSIFNFFLRNSLIIGKYRFLQEHRYGKKTPFRRLLTPFHRKYILNIIRVTLCYYIVSIFWFITIIGGPIKYYQYRFIPYILAENPQIKFRDAKKISKAMSDGYKKQLFLLDLSILYLLILKIIPILGVLYALPYEASINSEAYFLLRNHLFTGNNEKYINQYKTLLCERTFDTIPWWYNMDKYNKNISVPFPVFQLQDIIPEEKEHSHKTPYCFTDYILMFFLFCFIGWTWEVLLHLVTNHSLVNRGTMYGPWLPIYGTGGIMFIMLLSRYKADFPKTFLLTVLTSGFLEFGASWILDFFFNSRYWQYYDKFGNLNGRICTAGLLLFGIGGSFAIYIAGPYLHNKFSRVAKTKKALICTILCTLFIIDLIMCLVFGFNSGSGVGKKLS